MWLLVVWSPVEVVVWFLGKRDRAGAWRVRMGAAFMLVALLAYEFASMAFTGVEGYDDRTFDSGPWLIGCGGLAIGGLVLAVAGVRRCLRDEAPVASRLTT
jgi:hypothetical protein